MTELDETREAYKIQARTRHEINIGFATIGVRFCDLDRTYIDLRAKIGAGTYLGADVVIEGECVIGENCTILAGTRLTNCKIGKGTTVDHSVCIDSEVGEASTIGPFAYLRPNSHIGSRVKVGDFVEVKNSTLGDDTKVSHLSYIGDADIGCGVNVGCGVVFVNYDGKEKHRSSVENDAFIGCNVNIISPIKVGKGAYIAAGTTVTKDVPAGALSVARAGEKTLEGWTEKRGLLKARIEKRHKAKE